MKMTGRAGILAAVALIGIAALSPTAVFAQCLDAACANVAGTSCVLVGTFQSVEVTIRNYDTAGPTPIVVYGVVHNGLGQTVELDTATATLAAGGYADVYLVAYSLPSDAYNETVFATTISTVPISQPVSVECPL